MPDAYGGNNLWYFLMPFIKYQQKLIRGKITPYEFLVSNNIPVHVVGNLVIVMNYNIVMISLRLGLLNNQDTLS